ncbi:peptidyl-prolyl cis-trans isomerase [Neobacillus dielmonensis]|uniref:peptidyl-prolyl cis-trans isomerase n=1 Tax=Neobacillus dielmonensis TaxID=1347369 RepID=UPI0005AB81AC|nr:peptidyl-prolyl cis-trans isomerase [Neobacillus dielmonensis]
MGKKQLWLVIAGLLMLNCLTVAYFLSRDTEASGGSETVATIGSQEITRQDWLHELETRYGKDVLKEMVDQKVVQELADKYHIKAADSEVDREYRLLQATNNSFNQKNFPSEKKWKEQIKNSLLLEEILTKDAIVSEKEIKNYYEKNKDLYNVPEAYRLSHIVVKTKQEAEKTLKELKQGSSFQALAMERSIDEFSANEGGNIGYITSEDELYPSSYITTAKKLKKGAYGGPIKTDQGYAIVKLEGKISGKTYSFKEVKNQIRRQIALEQMNTPASAEPLWEAAKVDWFYGNTKQEQ